MESEESGIIPAPSQPVVPQSAVPSFLRPLITPTLTEDGIVQLDIAWIVTGPGNALGKDPETGELVIKHRETCRMPIIRGCGYVSDVGVPENSIAKAGLGPFFVDPATGMRHFVVQAERMDMNTEALPMGG